VLKALFTLSVWQYGTQKFGKQFADDNRICYCCIVVQDPSEGPLTKHIHLTSALIIRNLARYSSLGRR